MKPRKLISVDFRQRKARPDRGAIQIKGNGAVEISPVGHDVRVAQSGETLSPGMAVSITSSHRNRSKSGMYAVE